MTGNGYTGTNNVSAAGILLIDGYIYGPITTGVSVTENTLSGNDVDIYNAGAISGKKYSA